MAVIKTGAIYKSLTFDGIDSRDYGVYITGEAVYNAPTRRVNMIQIPGRNGLYAQDEGAFDNMTITYPAGLFGGTEADFASGIAAFRNALCSRVGYKRLEDDYNASEFRMAVYKEGLEVDPATLKAGEFTIAFECKPQRWLTSGETKRTLTSGGSLTNPTLFPAAPLFELVGYGAITLTSGGTSQSIDVAHIDTGIVSIGEAISKSFPASQSGANYSVVQPLDLSILNTGDTITIASCRAQYSPLPGTTATGVTAGSGDATVYISGGNYVFDFGELSFTKGTTTTKTQTATLAYTSAGTAGSFAATVRAIFASNQLTITATIEGRVLSFTGSIGAASGYSTMQNQGTTFIDCETGLCWQNVSGTLVSADSFVSLPVELPRLAANAATSFSFPNTITSLKVTPRWWQV